MSLCLRRTPLYLLLLVTALAATACVTEQRSEIVNKPWEPPAEPEARAELGSALLDLDRLVDRWFALSTQAGADAQRERVVLAPAIEARVARHLDELLGLARSRDEKVRRIIAVKSLAFCRDPRAVVVLTEALSERSEFRLLTTATWALSRISSPATEPGPLLDLVGHPDGDVRNNALMALWHVMDARRDAGVSPLDPVEAERARPLLEVALFEPEDAYIRGHAAAALGALGDPRSVDALLNLLRDAHPFVRTHTSLALAAVGDLRAVPELVKAMDGSPEGTPRSAVVAAVKMLLEGAGHRVPGHLGESGRRWEAYLEEIDLGGGDGGAGGGG